MSQERFVCIHAHFYQPPRESPWLERIEVQDSAYPYHDWNERVTAECYAPNATARILEDGLITRIVDNYSRISFNFGPTLLGWMEHAEPELYAAILDADRRSRERFSGHGSALAQAHSHLIQPLANSRDKKTQILWGKRDFEHRFGRAPEGMWLPETAVDLETLELLAQAGIRFTILTPYQARRFRQLGAGDDEWTDVGEVGIDPSMPYLCHLPSGAEIVLFFYDGPISRAVAFEQLLADGHRFAQRLLSGFDDERDHAQLVHIATDGETYGHHHRHGEMALAWALAFLEQQPGVRITNYGEFLERRPPTHEVEIHENTSWSCAHGIERWRSDCGCHTGWDPGWHQRWRQPLRESLDWLRDQLAARFEPAAAELLRDPWQARDDYVEVLLDRSPESVEAWLARHARTELDDAARVRVLHLLEMQRHAMYMTTSCGWFFNEISGIGTVQVLLYAARAIQLAARTFEDAVGLEDEMRRRLEAAPSNLARFGNGRGVWDALVRPLQLELDQIAAHFAVGSLFDEPGDDGQLFCYRFSQQRRQERRTGRAALAVGIVELASETTWEHGAFAYAVAHFGDHQITGGVEPLRDQQAFDAVAAAAEQAFDRVDFTEVVRLLAHHFERSSFSLRALFADEQRRVVGEIFASTLDAVRQQYRTIYEVHAPLMRFVAHLGMPVPEPFLVAARSYLQHQLEAALADPSDQLPFIQSLLRQVRELGLGLDASALARRLEASIHQLAQDLRAEPRDAERLERLTEVVGFSRELPLGLDLWKTSNIVWQLMQDTLPAVRDGDTGDAAERERWLLLFEQLGKSLGFRMPAVVPVS